MGKTKTVKLVNIVAAVLFLLLLVVHLAIGKWGGYGSMLTVGDVFVIQPALGFCTGYAFMFGLFYLLQARIDLVESGGRHWLRGIMLLITVLMLFVVLLMIVGVLSYICQIHIFSFSPGVYSFLLELCQTGWVWALLGVYWFVRLNANRVAELPEEE